MLLLRWKSLRHRHRRSVHIPLSQFEAVALYNIYPMTFFIWTHIFFVCSTHYLILTRFRNNIRTIHISYLLDAAKSIGSNITKNNSFELRVYKYEFIILRLSS